MSDQATERLMSGTTWTEFCDTLKTAGNVVLSERAPGDEQTRAEGFRYLSRLVRAGLRAFVEHADPLAPVLFRPVHETVKMGADNPDNYYQWARISGEQVYRIRGQRGSINTLSFNTYAGTYGMGGRSAQTGHLEASELQLEPDGSFEILLSQQRPAAGNWLPMEPDTSSLIVRQTFLDRSREQIARLRIEREGGAPGPAQLTAAHMDQALTSASRLVLGASMMFASWAGDFQKHVNQLPRFDDSTSLAAHGDPNIAYYHSYWQLAPGEALVVEVTPPPCEYWNFQLNNHWMESLDYVHHRVAINKSEARLRPDGSLRLVVAHEDPGGDNWLQTAGHQRGTMCFRWVRAEHHPQPATRVVALSELER